MIEPVITSQIGGYLFSWADTELSVKIGRLTVHSDGDVTGNLQITNSSKENPVILLPTSKINFSAERTRSQFAKQLTTKYPQSDIDFVELFDYLGHKIQELAISGGEVVEVWAEDDAPPPEYLLKPLIIKGVPNVIYGEKGVNKSTLCYAIGACMALPWDDNPLELEVGREPIKSLVLDWETDESIFRWYLSRMRKGMNLDTFLLFYRRCVLPLADELEAIEQYLSETGAEVIIIDSLAAAAGGEGSELKGSQSALQFNSALRKLNKTSLIVAQTSKPSDNQPAKHKTIYGSTLFTYYSRNIFELCRNEEDYSDTSHLALFHRECNFARKSQPMGFELVFDDAQKSISITREPISFSEFGQKLNTQSRVLDALKSGAMTVKDLTSLLDVSENSVRIAITRLSKQRKVIKVDKAWGLSL